MNQRSVEFVEENFRDGAAAEGLLAPIGDHLSLLGKKIPMGQVFIGLERPRLVGDLEATIEALRSVMPPKFINVHFTAAKAMFRFTRFMPPTAEVTPGQ
jgi:hypothetical protein